nr:DoxX family membrane protein [Arthrobacter antioxidans]
MSGRPAGNQEAVVTLVRVIARPLIASSFVVSGVDRLRTAGATAPQLKPVLTGVAKIVPSAGAITGNEKLVGQVLGATQVGAAVLLGIGRFSRVAALLLTLTTTVNALVDYRSADASSPEGKKARRSQLLKNLSLIGAVLLAAVDTNGRPGIAWRAEHLATDARRQLKKADKAVRKTASDVVGS